MRVISTKIPLTKGGKKYVLVTLFCHPMIAASVAVETEELSRYQCTAGTMQHGSRPAPSHRYTPSPPHQHCLDTQASSMLQAFVYWFVMDGQQIFSLLNVISSCASQPPTSVWLLTFSSQSSLEVSFQVLFILKPWTPRPLSHTFQTNQVLSLTLSLIIPYS